jgi:hypothetical protein
MGIVLKADAVSGSVKLSTLVQQHTSQQHHKFTLLSTKLQVRLYNRHNMFHLSGIFAALENLPGVRRCFHASRIEDQDLEMQMLGPSTSCTEQLESNENNTRSEDDIVKGVNQGDSRRLSCVTDTSGPDFATCQRIWREWWI